MRTGLDGAWSRAGALAVLSVLGLVLALTVDLPRVQDVRSWCDGAGRAGWLVMTLGLALVLLGPVPRSAAAVLVGVVAGFGPGLVIAQVGALIAAGLAFALSRTLGRSAATRLLGPSFERVDRLITEQGFVSVLVGRLLPMVPFVVLNYGAGLTRVRPGAYLLATAIGIVPGTVVQVGIGASAGFVVSHATTVTAVPLVAVILGLGVVAVFRWRRGQRTVVPPAG